MLLSRRGLVFAPALLLGACSGPISVTVTGDGDTPIFHVTALNGGPTEISFVSVVRLHPGRDAELMWSVANSSRRRREFHARYGKAPKGFGTDTTARPLERNVEYYVSSAGGPGSGSASFWLDDAGRVNPR